MDLDKLINIDCLQGFKDVDDNSIDLIVTSPPYNIGAGGSAFKFKGYDIYNDKNDTYEDFLLAVLKECYRTLKPSGSLMWNHKVRTVDKIAIHPLKTLFKTDFKLKQEIVWDLHDTHIHNKDRFYPINEMIYWLVKDETKTYFNSGFSELTTIWKMKRANKKDEGCNHPAPFTKELPKRSILAMTEIGDIVLDPFAGSGTTLLVAKELNRHYIGFELSDAYCKVADERLKF